MRGAPKVVPIYNIVTTDGCEGFPMSEGKGKGKGDDRWYGMRYRCYGYCEFMPTYNDGRETWATSRAPADNVNWDTRASGRRSGE